MLAEIATSQILHNASAFARRVTEPLNRYPHRFLLLGKMPDLQDCLRRAIAAEILDTEDSYLEINMRKVKMILKEDLQMTRASGCLSGRLRVVVRTVSAMWRADTRDCERLNKSLNMFVERSPNASFELQSSRACLKHFLSQALTATDDGKEAKRKWSTYKPVAQKLVNLCLNSWHDRREVQCSESRFAAPPLLQVPDDSTLAKEMSRLHPDSMTSVCKTWATCYNVTLNKSLSASDDSLPVLVFFLKSDGQTVSTDYFVAVEKVYRTHRLVRCSHEGWKIFVQQPLTITNTFFQIASYWDKIQDKTATNTVHIFQAGSRKTRSTLDECENLSFVGVASDPTSVLQMKRTTKKFREKVKQAVAKIDSKAGNDSNDTTSKSGAGGDDDDADADAGFDSDPGEGIEHDDDLDEGLNLLLEEADADVDASNELGDDDALLVNAVTSVFHEASKTPFVSDNLEETLGEYVEEMRETTMSDTIDLLERQRARNALNSGIFGKGDIEEFNSNADNDADDTGFLEAVLNQSGKCCIQNLNRNADARLFCSFLCSPLLFEWTMGQIVFNSSYSYDL